MSSLQRTIAQKWSESTTLTALVPMTKFFVGRFPETTLYDFPYVSVLMGNGFATHRTDKTQINRVIISFHVWVDDYDLENGMEIAGVIGDVLSNRCWQMSDTAKVLDVMDLGEAVAHQVDTPTIKAWEVVKMLAFYVERQRITQTDDCCAAGISDDESPIDEGE